MTDSPCKRHKYEFQKNVVNTTMRSSSTGTVIKQSMRGLYVCSVCGKQHVGQSQYIPKSMEEGAA
ncbi:MAG: hypothetical protein ACXV9T_02845 [Methylobacter sp.]